MPQPRFDFNIKSMFSFAILCCCYELMNHLLIQNIRPSLEDIPEDIAPLLQSCWSEDPNGRPEFTQVIDSLSNLLQTFVLKESSLPNMDDKTEKEVDCASDTSASQSRRQHKARRHRSSSFCLKCCYNFCLSDWPTGFVGVPCLGK